RVTQPYGRAVNATHKRRRTCQQEPNPIARSAFPSDLPPREHFPRDAQDAPVAQLDRAPDYESGGQEFESLRARQIRRKIKSLRGAAETDQTRTDLCPSHARKCSRTRLRCGASRPPGIFYTSMRIGTPIWVATGV